jgi:hypothetical protein
MGVDDIELLGINIATQAFFTNAAIGQRLQRAQFVSNVSFIGHNVSFNSAILVFRPVDCESQSYRRSKGAGKYEQSKDNRIWRQVKKLECVLIERRPYPGHEPNHGYPDRQHGIETSEPCKTTRPFPHIFPWSLSELRVERFIALLGNDFILPIHGQEPNYCRE